MQSIELHKLKILDNVFFLHPEKGWTNTFVISHSKKRISKDVEQHVILLAGYGPPVHGAFMLEEDDYYKKLNDKSINEYTKKLIMSSPDRSRFTFKMAEEVK